MPGSTEALFRGLVADVGKTQLLVLALPLCLPAIRKITIRNSRPQPTMAHYYGIIGNGCQLDDRSPVGRLILGKDATHVSVDIRFGGSPGDCPAKFGGPFGQPLHPSTQAETPVTTSSEAVPDSPALRFDVR